MISVLIVDDEYEIREGLLKRIPWSEYGIEKVLVADDGDTALEIAERMRPELIVTDIKMSRMSGLEFLGELQRMDDYGYKAILISGYDDFELVKHAMQLGAIDYILKPINTSELESIVLKAVELIMRESLDKHHHAQMIQEVHFATPKLQEELLREIVEHEYDPYRETRVSHRLQALKLEWMQSAPLLLMVVEADDLKAIVNQKGSPSERELVLFGIGNVVRQTLTEVCLSPTALFSDSRQKWVAVFDCSRFESVEHYYSISQICLQRINEFVKVKASIGLSSAPKELSHLHRLYGECCQLLDRKAVYGGNRVFTETECETDCERTELSIRETSEVLDLVRYGSDEEIAASMNGFDEMVKSWELCSLKDIQQSIFKWLMGIYRGASAAGWPDRTWERNPIALWEQLEQYDNLQSLKEQAQECLMAMAADHRKLTSMSSQIVQEAEKIIRTRFADNISLQTVTEEVHVTSVWLSKLFKKEKGKTFLEYLTEVRIMQAKAMLGDVKHKIYQISYQVGYKDPVYFSKVFKKQLGFTPKEYRKQLGIADE
ncbi:response regulator [Paenibacillus rhizovicinus]|uniref:Response regulator n=1 Tax=Paenibacillus rhizovicinus TaxID=2704463 RepID=A0A6C0NTI5_9BACL|nr:response regulator [Paenibacillus rhizovicinus]QHW29529.1 response regulator [Paenibacillus rhizovicinus]